MTTLNFAHRSNQSERMDSEVVAFEDFRDCLRDLTLVNRLTLAYRPTIDFFQRLVANKQHLRQPIRVVDVGSGYGDMLRKIDAWAYKHRVAVSLTGIDLNPWSARAAAQAPRTHSQIRWITTDALAYDPPEGIDVVISSLFTHHLEDKYVVRFLQWMESRAKIGWFINDLHRHALAYHVFRLVSQRIKIHRFVQHDGPVSIARAFVVDDWKRLIREAKIKPETATIKKCFPFRLTVARIKQP